MVIAYLAQHIPNLLKKLSFVLILIALGFSLQAKTKELPYVVMVSFDGFRYDYADSLVLPHFKMLQEKGAHAESLIPCFPSKTFPNHVSLATGLYPDHHGIVSNRFYDPVSKEKYTAREAHFYSPNAIWNVARRQGVISASYYWVGSDVSDPEFQPNYFYVYGQGGDVNDRIHQTLDWLKLPEKKRPHLITLYFEFPDNYSHSFSPFGEETLQSVYRADSILGVLMDGFDQLNIPLNLIVVSDHGHTDLSLSPDKLMGIQDLINPADTSFRVYDNGSYVQVYCEDQQKTDSLYDLLSAKENHFKVYKRSELPEHWHYGETARCGDLFLNAAPGYYFKNMKQQEIAEMKNPGKVVGVHGYDPILVKDMHGIFYAMGPNIKAGQQLPSFPNIDVFPLVAKILNLNLPKIDGNPATLNGIYEP